MLIARRNAIFFSGFQIFSFPIQNITTLRVSTFLLTWLWSDVRKYDPIKSFQCISIYICIYMTHVFFLSLSSCK
ncbi:hypothetical protein F4810DRAFT_131418 [Camillea tinctor]|nr:hypothetical protein F4810DRAFT_131418 [Camillea tinctor]